MAWNINGYNVFETAIELAIIWIIIFLAFRFLQGTRGGGVIRGLFILLLPLWLLQMLPARLAEFDRLDFFADQFLTGLFLLLIIIFQPELRQAAVRVSQSGLFASFRKMSTVGGTTISAIAEASVFLGRNQFGGLIAIERENSTSDHVIGGQSIEAAVSSPLLQSIFWPNNPLHDLGLIINGDRITKASVQFPLADESAMLSQDLGSRHRAGVGLSMRCDALVIIISEETGRVSFADHGELIFIDRDDVESELSKRLNPIKEEVVQEQSAAESMETPSTASEPTE
ncbi:MAG: DNA integrity scanning protein DisA nucleotide-binding domain protein [Planctomycetes bacterium]|nr:DNA integrity scanning protein DisA nucleotide-binding domain protein [Planctomycetota bacterium]